MAYRRVFPNGTNKDAKDFFRIRFTKEGDSMCLKKFHEDPIEKRPLYCDEHEIEISDGKKALELQKRGYVSMLWNPDYNFGIEVES